MDAELADLAATKWPGAYRCRIYNFLTNFTTMAELLAMTREEVLREPAFGVGSLWRLEEALADRGLHLAHGGSPTLRDLAWWRATLNEST